MAKLTRRKRASHGTKAGTSKHAAEGRKKLFIAAMLANGRNATQAAIAAGYSARTAKQQGSRLLTHVDVRRALEEQSQALELRCGLTAEHLRKSMDRAIHFDPRKLFREDGTAKAPLELDDDTAFALASVKLTTTTDAKGFQTSSWEYKVVDRNAARDQANRHLGLYEKDNHQKADMIAAFIEAVSNKSRGLPPKKRAR